MDSLLNVQIEIREPIFFERIKKNELISKISKVTSDYFHRFMKMFQSDHKIEARSKTIALSLSKIQKAFQHAPPFIKLNHKNKVKFLYRLLDDPNIQRLSTEQLVQWMRVVAPLFNDVLSNASFIERNKLIYTLSLIKISPLKTAVFPRITKSTHIERGKILTPFPKYNYITLVDNFFISSQWQGISPDHKGKTAATLENAKAAFIYIQGIKHLFWEYPDYCYIKAELMVGHLLSLGFKEKTIFRIAVIGDGIGRKLSDGSKQKWNFHIATGIILENSEMWIFDLLLSPDKLLSKEAWLKLSQLNNPKDRLILSYPDQSIPINAKIEFPHSFKGYTVFMSHNMNILSVKSLHIPCRQSIASFISSTIKVHALISGQKITKDSIAALFQKTPNVAAFMIEALFPAPSGEPPKLTPPPGLPLYPTSGCVI